MVQIRAMTQQDVPAVSQLLEKVLAAYLFADHRCRDHVTHLG